MGFSIDTGKMLAAAVLLTAAVACSPIHTYHGYVPPEHQLRNIVVGESGRAEVLEIAGPPLTRNDTYGESWFYVSSHFQKDGYKEVEEVDRQVVAISFDSEGVVSNVEKYELRDGRTVSISRRVTETNIGRLNFVDQLLRGLGRIDPGRTFSS